MLNMKYLIWVVCRARLTVATRPLTLREASYTSSYQDCVPHLILADSAVLPHRFVACQMAPAAIISARLTSSALLVASRNSLSGLESPSLLEILLVLAAVCKARSSRS